MTRRPGAMHLVTTRRQHNGKEYQTTLLRRSFRADGKVKNETLANLSYLPAPTIELIRHSLAGKVHVLAGEGFEVARSLPHGHVAAVHAYAAALGFGGFLGRVGRQHDVALALIIAQVCRPDSPPQTCRWWADTTLAVDLDVADLGMPDSGTPDSGIEGAGTDEIDAVSDWLARRQGLIEAELADFRVDSQPWVAQLASYLRGHLARAWSPLGVGPPEDGALGGEVVSTLGHLATLARNTIVFANGVSVDQLTTPTPRQLRAFQLLGATVPLTLRGDAVR